MKQKARSAQLINLSMVAYILWLMLPALQAASRGFTGAACVALFGLGVLWDTETLRKQWPDLLLRAVCAALMPLFIRLFMDRGGNAAVGFYAQNAMFWFPLVFVGYVRRCENPAMWKRLQWICLAAVVTTILTTIGWLIEGMLRDSGAAVYSRALGNAEPGQEAYLKTLMLRNIGGYDFIYAMVAALPLTCIAISQSRGSARWAYAALAFLQMVVIFLSQYTYALFYALAIVLLELLAFLIRCLSRRRIKTGASLLYALVLLVPAAIISLPLLSQAAQFFNQLELYNLSANLRYLLRFLQDEAALPGTRLAYYQIAWDGFLHSPLIGSLAGAEALFSYHSDLLDLLSGAGILGTLAAGLMIWLMGRGSLRGLRSHPCKVRLILMYSTVLVIAALGTVVYSRDISLIMMLGALFVLESKPA